MPGAVHYYRVTLPLSSLRVHEMTGNLFFCFKSPTASAKVEASQRTVDRERLSCSGPSLEATETKDRKPEQDTIYFIANLTYELLKLKRFY